MNDIMNKTYELIDILDNSDIINNIEIYKNKIINNKEIQELISIGNNTQDDYIIRDIRINLYKYEDYKKYMDNYNKLMYIVMDINKRFNEIINERGCYKI